MVRKEQYENRTVLALKDLHLLKLVREGDFVISLRSFQGGIEYAREQGIISPAYTVLYPIQPELHGYLAWLFKSKPYIENLSLYVTGIRQGQNIDYERLSRSALVFPPLPEQTTIVRFLNHVDRRIQRYISSKQKLIKLLEEQKQAIIHRAVTCGLDSDVRLKPSGVDWLGDVPEHWEIRQLRQCVSIKGGMTPSMENRQFWDGTIPWITPKDMKQSSLSDSSVRVSEMALNETPLQLIKPPAVLMVVRGMILARKVPIAWTTAPVTVNQDMKAMIPVQQVRAEFLAAQLEAAQDAFVPLIDEAGHGTRRLPTNRWRTISVSVPPENEQLAILRYLKETTNTIALVIGRTHREISLLREYRTRLIADVVTGKLDVRKAAAQLPDEGAMDGQNEPPVDEIEAEEHEDAIAGEVEA